MRKSLGPLHVAIMVLGSAALRASAQQPFMIPSNGNTTNVPSSNAAPGVSSVFYNTLVNKQNTSFMYFKPSLSTNPPITQPQSSFPNLQ